MTGFVILGRLPGLNEYTAACRSNAYQGSAMKRRAQNEVETAIACAVFTKKLPVKLKEPVRINYKFVEPNKRRDQDNVSSFAKKVIQDALVSTLLLQNDGWDNIRGSSEEFAVDKKNPRIEVMIEEAGDDGAGV